VSRLLAIDVGERRIGLAIADTETGSIRQLATIRRATSARDGRTIARVVAEQAIDELVVGLPLNSDDSEGPQAQLTRDWAAGIAAAVARPISWRDERLTSQLAELHAGRPARGRSGGPPSPAARNAYRARIDRLAAAGIAQAELDARQAGRER
jgi:putative Holliday junction resolvase